MKSTEVRLLIGSIPANSAAFNEAMRTIRDNWISHQSYTLYCQGAFDQQIAAHVASGATHYLAHEEHDWGYVSLSVRRGPRKGVMASRSRALQAFRIKTFLVTEKDDRAFAEGDLGAQIKFRRRLWAFLHMHDIYSKNQ